MAVAGDAADAVVATSPPLRVGVTGHRSFDDHASVGAAVDAVLDALVDRAGSLGRGPLEVWSSLAEGADRLVARRSIERAGATVVAVLPLAPDDYRSDFADAASRDEFDSLLSVAAAIHVVGPASDRLVAYERAGLLVVDRTEILIALWDGAPPRGRGGTAEIVEAARACGREVIVVPVTREER